MDNQDVSGKYQLCIGASSSEEYDGKGFAAVLPMNGVFKEENYTDLFDLMISLVKLPDLMIYIKSSIPTLVKHIEKRGRDFEKSIRIDYLQGLNKRYEDWIKDYKGRLIIIDGDNLEFGENPEDFRKVTDLIDAELFGLFAEKGV
jgi:deoxyadenosine/deoxycytidine kinase